VNLKLETFKFYIRDWLENFTVKKSNFFHRMKKSSILFPGIITVHREIKLKNQIKLILTPW